MGSLESNRSRVTEEVSPTVVIMVTQEVSPTVVTPGALSSPPSPTS